MDDSSVVLVVAVLVILFAIIELVKKVVSKKGKTNVVEEEVLNAIEKIVSKELGDVLLNAGIEDNYEAFKNQVVYSLLDVIRKYTDKKGGTLDAIADSITDDTIIDAIEMVIDVSGTEDKIKKAYDLIITDRMKEIENEEAKVVEENKALEEGTFESSEEEEETSEEENPDFTEEPTVEVVGDMEEAAEIGAGDAAMSDF
jgi:Ran GTPase-activating protein (RanGAP) involved in mRNA processing and transport